jgi:Icc-related predicted phosphoesterase
MKIDRRDFLTLAGLGGVVVVSGFGGGSTVSASAAENDFFFVQFSDTHWGFADPAINPDSMGTLRKAVEAVNSLKVQPDFIVFTGDLSHVTDDDNERRKRLSEFRNIVSQLKLKNLRFLPGEHDAGLDEGKAYKEYFGETYYTFDHKGVHFIVLDNVSDPTSNIGEVQLKWLSADLKKRNRNSRIVVFTHRPLYELYPDWDWYTRDGSKAIDLLSNYSKVAVFHGHVHQELHRNAGHISYHAAKGLMYAFPPPGSVPKKTQIPWDAKQPYKGLGFRSVNAKSRQADYPISEYSVQGEKL